ncbi:MAG: leucine-rich repeat protein [Opitutales bacterium]
MKTTTNILLGVIISSSILKGDGNNNKTKLEPVYLANVAMYLPREEKTKLRQISSNGQIGLEITKTNTEPIYTEKDALILCEKLFEDGSQAKQTIFQRKHTGRFNRTEDGNIEITINGITGIVNGEFTKPSQNLTIIKNPTIRTQSGNIYRCGDIELLLYAGNAFKMKEYLVPNKPVCYPHLISKVNQQHPNIDVCYYKYNKNIMFTYPFDENLCKEIVNYGKSFSLVFVIDDIFAEALGNILPHTNDTASILDLLIQGGLSLPTAQQIMNNNAITISFSDSFYIPDEVTKIDYNGVRIEATECIFGHNNYPQVTTLNMNCVEKFSEKFWGKCSFPNIENADFSGLQIIPNNFPANFPHIANFPNLREINSYGLSQSKTKEIELGDYNTKLNPNCFSAATLQKVNLGGTITIPLGAFSYCANIKHVIAKEVTEIEDTCFLGSPIEAVFLPKVKIITPEAFLGTPQLEIVILPNLKKIVSKNIIETIDRKYDTKIQGAFCHYSFEEECFINNPKLRVFIPQGTQLNRCYFIQNNTEGSIDYPTISKDNIIHLSEQEIQGSYVLSDITEVLSLEQYLALIKYLKECSTEHILNLLRNLAKETPHSPNDKHVFLEQLKTYSNKEMQNWLNNLGK